MKGYVGFWGGRLMLSPFCFVALGTLYYVEGCVPFFIIVLSALIHETGHFVAVYMYKSRVLNVYVNPMGCVINYEYEKLSYKSQKNIALAGALFNFVFFALGSVVFLIFPTVETLLFAVANVFFGLFNLIPIKGNDGSNAIYFMLAQRASQEKATEIKRTAEIIASAVLICVGVWLYTASGASPVVLALLVFAVM